MNGPELSSTDVDAPDEAVGGLESTLRELREAGLLGAGVAPGRLYREWVSWMLRSELAPAAGDGRPVDGAGGTGHSGPPVDGAGKMISLARLESVGAGTFDGLDGCTIWRNPDGRPYVRIEDGDRAREIVRLTELLNGGQPTLADARRDRNCWSYEGLWGLNSGDAGMVLNNGGALVATPEGTMMAAPGDKDLGVIPNAVGWFAARGGTTWGEMYVINGSFARPEDVLRESIESGDPPPGSGAPDLGRLLRHERVHSEQWARYGYLQFIWKYLIGNDPNDPCHHPLEQEAGLEDGGYRC